MTRPLEWMTAVRDHPARPPAAQQHVLDRLALRMDWKTGTGPASVAQLAADADCKERTVWRATVWARGTRLLVRTRRGYRVGDKHYASEWQLVIPESVPDSADRSAQSRPDSADRSDAEPTGLLGPSDLTLGTTRPDSRDAPSRPSPSRPRSSSARQPADLIIRAVYPDATDDEIEIMIKERIANGARDARAVLAHEARQGTLRLPCDGGGTGRHSGACRDGDSSRCGMGWCTCRCHNEPGAP